MTIKFAGVGVFQTISKILGGYEVTGFVHRVAAVITFLYFGLHLGYLIRRKKRKEATFRDMLTGENTMMFRKKDLFDFFHTIKWFLGLGPRPQYGRWTYWEKFDYFAVFWGVAVIGLSGIIMWFPVASTYVLPGWLINVALIVHSDEALLAAGFIFTFHFFNVHFRLEKFPMDPVIFSGRMTRAEMLHERKRWYDRLEADGQLDTLRLRDEWSQWKRVMHPLGFLAFGIGTVLLVLIFFAMGARLFGH